MKKDEQVSAMLERLRQLRAADTGGRVRDRVLRWVEDPLKPRTPDGRLRINLILLLLALLAVMAIGTFLFFSLVGL